MVCRRLSVERREVMEELPSGPGGRLAGIEERPQDLELITHALTPRRAQKEFSCPNVQYACANEKACLVVAGTDLVRDGTILSGPLLVRFGVKPSPHGSSRRAELLLRQVLMEIEQALQVLGPDLTDQCDHSYDHGDAADGASEVSESREHARSFNVCGECLRPTSERSLSHLRREATQS